MVHKYTLFGYNIALDVESGAVHILSDIAYKMLDYINLMLKESDVLPKDCTTDIRYQLAKYDGLEVGEAYAEILELYENDVLFSKPADVKFDAPEQIPVKAMCLNISHDCNMACKYCFAGKGSFGVDKGKKYMSEETGINAINFLLDNSMGRKNLEVDFFGGEPLLNFDTVKNIVEKTREFEKEKNKNVRFTLTTNGTLLDDDKIAYINEHMSNIVLSLDGTQATNDNMRTYGDESGSYADIIPLYKKLVETRGDKDYYVRGTFTRHNLNFAKDAIHIAELGFSSVSVEPVVAEEEADYSIRKQDLPVIFREYEVLAREIIKRLRKGENSLNFFHFNIDLEEGPCIYKRVKGCGAGSEYVAVTPDGDIYPCHQFVGNAEYRLGNVNLSEKIILNRELMSKFFDNNIIKNQECKECWAKYFCGGGCAANNVKSNEDIYKPYELACEMEKKRVECAIAIKIATDTTE